MKDDRGELDLTKQIDDKDTLVKTLRQRVNELMAINKSHQQLMAKQIDDYFNVRMNNTRNSGM